eukprot:m.23616 g.23616  ORF g.23616 m.23616 type:complete len:117 (+) comp11028_c0_seq2:369-719(+)
MHHILTRPRKHQHFGTASELPPHRLKFFSVALPIFLVFVREVVPTVNSVLWKPKTPSQFSLCVDATQPCEASHPICTPVLMPRRYCALTLPTIGLITRGRRSSDDPEDYTPNVQDG